MGLTIYYRLYAPHLKSRKEALEIVDQLRTFAKTLPIHRCSKITAWSRERGPEEVGRFHGYILPLGKNKDDTSYLHVEPLELVMFRINHRGSETASFGLARFPAEAQDTEKGIARQRTRLRGWNWQNFCKTQYASLPSAGGWSNFFNIHDSICQILKEAERLGIKVKVSDEGGYWKNQDPEKLRAAVEKCNALVAAFVGSFKDMMKDQTEGVVAPITQDPTFEHLEAKGQKEWNKRRRKGKT